MKENLHKGSQSHCFLYVIPRVYLEKVWVLTLLRTESFLEVRLGGAGYSKALSTHNIEVIDEFVFIISHHLKFLNLR